MSISGIYGSSEDYDCWWAFLRTSEQYKVLSCNNISSTNCVGKNFQYVLYKKKFFHQVILCLTLSDYHLPPLRVQLMAVLTVCWSTSVMFLLFIKMWQSCNGLRPTYPSLTLAIADVSWLFAVVVVTICADVIVEFFHIAPICLLCSRHGNSKVKFYLPK